MTALLDLSPDELPTTTRAVRRRLDLERPVDLDLVRECLRVALQAPSGSNAQGWHWVVITDADQRARIAELYRAAFNEYREGATHTGGLFAADVERAPVRQRVSRCELPATGGLELHARCARTRPRDRMDRPAPAPREGSCRDSPATWGSSARPADPHRPQHRR